MLMPTALTDRLLGRAGLTAICGTHIYWGELPQSVNPAKQAAVRLQVISDPRPQHLKGPIAMRETRVQADCMSPRHAEAHALAAAIIAATADPGTFLGVRFGRCFAEGPGDYGERTAAGFVHRASLDLLLWHNGD